MFRAELDSLLHQSSGTQLPGVTKEEALLHLGLRAIEQVEDGQVSKNVFFLFHNVENCIKSVVFSRRYAHDKAIAVEIPRPLKGGHQHRPGTINSFSSVEKVLGLPT